MPIHSRPLFASLLATMLRAQSSSVYGDSRSHRLLLWLAIVVSVTTCNVHHMKAALRLRAGKSHHSRAGLVKVIERKRDCGVGGEGHVLCGHGLSGVAGAAPDAVWQAIALVDAQHACSA